MGASQSVSTKKSAIYVASRDGDGEEGKTQGPGDLDTREGLHARCSTTLAAVLQDLRDVDPDSVLEWAEGESAHSVRMLLKKVLTQADSDPSDEVLRKVDRLLLHERKSDNLIRAADLPRAGAAGDLAKLAVWQGDITTLEIGAIVNAANDRMLGCFKPNHPVRHPRRLAHVCPNQCRSDRQHHPQQGRASPAQGLPEVHARAGPPRGDRRCEGGWGCQLTADSWRLSLMWLMPAMLADHPRVLPALRLRAAHGGPHRAVPRP